VNKKIKITKQHIMSSAWAAVLVYFLVASIIFTMFAAIGLEHLHDTRPEAFEGLKQIYLTYDMIFFMLWMQPTIMLGLLLSLLFIDVKFTKGIFKSKEKKDE